MLMVTSHAQSLHLGSGSIADSCHTITMLTVNASTPVCKFPRMTKDHLAMRIKTFRHSKECRDVLLGQEVEVVQAEGSRGDSC